MPVLWVQLISWLVLAFCAFTATHLRWFCITLFVIGTTLFFNSLYISWCLRRNSRYLLREYPNDPEVRRLVYKESLKMLSNKLWINRLKDLFRRKRRTILNDH